MCLTVNKRKIVNHDWYLELCLETFEHSYENPEYRSYRSDRSGEDKPAAASKNLFKKLPVGFWLRSSTDFDSTPNGA